MPDPVPAPSAAWTPKEFALRSLLPLAVLLLLASTLILGAYAFAALGALWWLASNRIGGA